MKMQWSKVVATGVVSMALAAAGAQTTVTSTSKSSTFTSTATGGSQVGNPPTAKDDLFAGTEVFAKNASDVTEVTMDPDTLGMVGGRDKTRARTMVLNVVRTYEYDKPGMYRIEDVDAFRNKLNTGEWHCSVHTRSLKTGESTDVCNRRRADDMVETAIITVEAKELTFIHTIRRRSHEESGPGDGGDAMMFPLGSLPQMAMLSVQPQIEMALKSVDMSAIQAQVQMSLKNLPVLDSAEMQKRMAEVQKSLSDAGKQMQEGGKKPE